MISLLRRLVEQQVRFVVVGGMAAAAYGSSVVTEDVDVCAPLDEENVRMILAALSGLNPRQRMRPDRPALPSDPAQLRGLRNLYIVCDAGQIDFLGELTGVGTYELVAKNAIVLDLGGFTCSVISLDDLIRSKEAMARPKDVRAAQELQLIRDKQRR